MAKVSINNLKEYAGRITAPTQVLYQVTMTRVVRDWFLANLERRASKVAEALASDTIGEKKRLKREA